ncbi:MAG: hypothetical protein GF384_01005, partial [Elusimicrobia bacterium]|nr:hypothetical protein [Elusimicrobiota bacterium]
MNVKTVFFLAVALGCVILSFHSLVSFPPVNDDEVETAAIADNFRKHGTMEYPLDRDVVHPDFEKLSASRFVYFQSIHIGLLSLIQHCIGVQLTGMRMVSFCMWAAIGLMLFFLLRQYFPVDYVYAGVIIWMSSIDGLIASHLVRPDSIIGLSVIILFVLASQYQEKRKPILSLISGFTAGTALGIHANGLLMVFLVVLFYVFIEDTAKNRFKCLLFVSIGLILGSIVWLSLIDVSSYAIFKSTWEWHFIKSQAQTMWLKRLIPWVLGDSVIQILANASSYYLKRSMYSFELWIVAGTANFMLIMFSLMWVFVKKPGNKLIQTAQWGLLIALISIG